jgi:eukaryotic-like serine/threonine-protein kinase
MSTAVADFWRLIAESRLLSPAEAQKSAEELSRAGPAAANDVQQAAKWLVQSGTLSQYQAKILLAGRPGPFVYGDYVVCDRAEHSRLKGLFRARHAPTKHPVGLLFLAGAALDDPGALARLVPRVAVARKASQAEPRLSGCYQFVDQGKFKFLVTEDLQGDSLDERLAKPSAKLSISDSCQMVRMVAQGLAALHSLGQAHGHVRPANVWLSDGGPAQLLQFPLLSDPLSAGAPPATVDDQLDYLAPELAAPGSVCEPRSDVYSLGCLLYTLLAGQPPFSGGNRQSKLARHAKEPPAPVTKLNPLVPTALTHVLTYLLQKDPAKRYADAAAVAEALQAYSGAAPQISPPATLAHYETWLGRVEAGQAPAPAGQPVPPPPRPAVAVARAVSPNGGPPGPLRAQPVGQHAVAQPIATPMPVAPRAFHPSPVATAVHPVAATALAAIPLEPPPFLPVTDSAEGTVSATRRRTKKRSKTVVAGGIFVGAVVLLLGVGLLLTSRNEERTQPDKFVAGVPTGPLDTSPTPTTPAGFQESANEDVGEQNSLAKEPIQGVGQSIWQSPTSGEPIDLAWLPSGVQVVLALRPAELTQQSEWQKLSDKRTLGLLGQWLTDDLPQVTGKTLDQLETVVAGLLDGSPGPPKVALVARSSDEFKLDELRSTWGDAKQEEIGGQAISVQASRAFCLPTSGADRLLVIAPAAELRELVKSGGEATALRREMEILVQSSDDQRQFTLLIAPNFPLTDGKGLFVDEGVKLIQPLRTFLELQDSDGKVELPKAAMLSCHLGDNLFIELRLYDSSGKPAKDAAREFQGRINHLPRQVSGYVRDLALSNYSKPVLWDYKDQLDVLCRFTRLGVEGKQVVLRAYLPAIAAHNLLMGGHLALLENPGSGSPVATVASAPQAGASQSVAEKLKKKTNLSFPRNTLEQSVKLLGDDIGVEIIILGNDLREEGITKNQSFGLDEKEQPADEILRKIMMKANPDGKLVYVIKPKEGGGEDVLYITTRGAAKKRGDKLPPELENAK